MIIIFLSIIGGFLFTNWTRTLPAKDFLAWNLTFDAALGVFGLLFAPLVLVVIPVLLLLANRRYHEKLEVERKAAIK